MMMRHIVPGVCLALLASPATQASTLGVRVVGADGRPAKDVVVTLRLTGKTGPAARAQQDSAQVVQRNTQFQPFISVVPVGTNVSFPNQDPFKHHVYSFSPAKRFELKLFAKDQARSVLFDRPGVIAIGCNIHDNMVAYIYVTDTLWTGRTDANGQVSFGDVPAQAVELSVWHPNLAAPANVVTKQISLGAANRVETVPVKFRPAALRNTGGY